VYKDNCFLDSVPNEYTNSYDYYYESHVDVDNIIHGKSTLRLYLSPISKRIYKMAVVEWMGDPGDRAQKYEYLKHGIRTRHGPIIESSGDFNTSFTKSGVLSIKTSYSKTFSEYVVTEYINSVGYNRMLTESTSYEN
jgi:hypothetical protein